MWGKKPVSTPKSLHLSQKVKKNRASLLVNHHFMIFLVPLDWTPLRQLSVSSLFKLSEGELIIFKDLTKKQFFPHLADGKVPFEKTLLQDREEPTVGGEWEL